MLMGHYGNYDHDDDPRPRKETQPEAPLHSGQDMAATLMYLGMGAIFLVVGYAILSLVLLAFGVKLPSIDGIYRVITDMGDR